MILIDVSMRTKGVYIFFLSACVVGLGFGVTFMVSTALAQRSVAPDAVAESMSTCFLIEYAGISVPALLAGISISWFGIQSVTDVFVGSIILLSVAFLVKNHRIVSQSAVG